MPVISQLKGKDDDATAKSGSRGDQHGNPPADVGANLRRLRKQQGLSLDTLAKLSSVSRAMLGQIETGKSIPTITLIWKVANALNVPIATLIESPRPTRICVLPRASAKLLVSSEGRFTLRPFASPEVELRAEFFELRIAPGHREYEEPYLPGSRASLVVAVGSLCFGAGDELPAELCEGDAILFEADVAKVYFNPGPSDAVAYLVITPARVHNAKR